MIVPREIAAEVVSLEGYRLQALELDPYPETWSSIPPSDYRLTLRIEDD